MSLLKRELRHVIHPFGPVIDENAKILILGSIPSVKSVENGAPSKQVLARYERVSRL